MTDMKRLSSWGEDPSSGLTSMSKLDQLITEHKLKGRKSKATQIPTYNPDIPFVDVDHQVLAFHDAIRNNDLDAVCSFIKDGIDPNAEDVTTGKVPLIEATHRGYIDIVKALLAAGANVNLQNAQGTTALHMSVNGKNYHHELARLFLKRPESNYDIQEKGTGDTPIHILARVAVSKKNAYQELMIELLKDMALRCDLSIKNKDGNTPLHCMARGTRDDCHAMRYMLVRDPDINITNLLGETPLATAIDNGNFNMAHVLLEKDIDMSIQDKCGYTYLHYAAKKNNEKLLDVLLVRGCDGNAKDFHGDTPLHIAAGRGYDDVARRLLSEGAVQVNAQNNLGFTPLMCAVDSGFLNIVAMLIHTECDVNIRSETTNQTAVDIAKEQMEKRNRKEIYKLLTAGAN